MQLGIPNRRQFLEAIATVGVMTTLSGTISAASGPSATRWPKLTGSPVLDSLHPVIENSRDVHTHVDKIVEVASWMAYEELPMPDYQLPAGVGVNDPNEAIDFIMVADVIETAFTPFSPHVKFTTQNT